MNSERQLSLREHLKDLRSALVKGCLSFLLGFGLSWIFKDFLLEWLHEPIAPYLIATDGKLIFTSPLEKFSSYIKICFFSAVLISCPYWMFQAWQFVSPGLYKNEKKWSLLFVTLSTCLFLSGIGFIYFVVFPMAFKFLLLFGSHGELPYISLKEYLSFFIRTSLVFGLVFETPLVLTLLIKLKIVSVKKLKSSRPYVMVFIAIVSAFITPPDILSMFFVMLPLYMFFEASLWIGQRI